MIVLAILITNGGIAMIKLDPKSIADWYTNERHTMKFKDRFMIRGAGLLWIPIAGAPIILLTIITINMYAELSNKFEMTSIVLPEIVIWALFIIFSIVEINRIRILYKYETYFTQSVIKLNELHSEEINSHNANAQQLILDQTKAFEEIRRQFNNLQSTMGAWQYNDKTFKDMFAIATKHYNAPEDLFLAIQNKMNDFFDKFYRVKNG